MKMGKNYNHVVALDVVKNKKDLSFTLGLLKNNLLPLYIQNVLV